MNSLMGYFLVTLRAKENWGKYRAIRWNRRKYCCVNSHGQGAAAHRRRHDAGDHEEGVASMRR